jgi:hypothetical protein
LRPAVERRDGVGRERARRRPRRRRASSAWSCSPRSPRRPATGEASTDVIAAELDRFSAANGKIIPGFGHRWHGVDPRAVRPARAGREAEEAGVVRGRFARIAQGIERRLTAQKGQADPDEHRRRDRR